MNERNAEAVLAQDVAEQPSELPYDLLVHVGGGLPNGQWAQPAEPSPLSAETQMLPNGSW